MMPASHVLSVASLVALCACARPQVPLRDAQGQVHLVEAATPSEYTEAVERGRTAPVASRPLRMQERSPAAEAQELPWIVDDAPAALALAKAKGLPVFVDVWATWCHSCVHMRAFVLNDAAIRAHAGDAVWLSVDADKPANAAFLAEAKVSAYPTFLVLAPGGVERARWAGTMDAEQVVRFFADGKVVDDVLAAVRKRADAGDNEGCASQARELLGTFDQRGRWRDELALRTAYRECANKIRMQAHNEGDESRVSLWGYLRRLNESAKAAELLNAADEISSGYEVLLDGPEVTRADRVGVATHWFDVLERFAAASATPEQRSAFDAHRVLAYIAAEKPEKAIPMLEQTRRDFPRDFNPRARLAKVYLAMKDYPNARTEAAAALALVDGPRTVRVVALTADVETAVGDMRAECSQLETGVARCKKLWLAPSAEKALADLEKRLSKLKAR